MNGLIKLLLLISGLSVVACSDKESQAFVDKCKKDELCVERYKQAALAIAGTAAVSGLAQVADAGATTLTGQVPNVSVLPASVSTAVTNAQIQAQSQKIAQQLQQVNSASDSQNYSPASLSTTDEASRAPASQIANNPDGEIIR
jgi:hypothetical protein